MRQKLLLAIVFTIVTLSLSACGNNNNTAIDGEMTLKVGASPLPHAEILKQIAPALKEQGINLKVVEFTDYVLPNEQVNAGELDANFFQHVPYLEDQKEKRGYKLVSVAGIHIEPFGIYSKNIESIEELQDGAKIAIPNDPTNGGRSLLLLAKKTD